jgi:hypothetical protein
MGVALAALGALALALAGLRFPGRNGFLAFGLAILTLIFGGKSETSAAAMLGCGFMALFSTPTIFSALVSAGILALSSALLPWANGGKVESYLPLFAFAFSLFLAEGARRMKKPAGLWDERWFIIACLFIVAGFAGWMWEGTLNGSLFRPGSWAAIALMSCAFVASGWQKKRFGGEILTLLALAGLWLII